MFVSRCFYSLARTKAGSIPHKDIHSDIYFGVTPKQVRRFAYTYTRACNRKMPGSWAVNEMAVPNCLSSFLKEKT